MKKTIIKSSLFAIVCLLAVSSKSFAQDSPRYPCGPGGIVDPPEPKYPHGIVDEPRYPPREPGGIVEPPEPKCPRGIVDEPRYPREPRQYPRYHEIYN